MSLLGTVVAVVSVAFFALMIGMQVLIRRRSAAMVGTAPPLPGPLGDQLARSPRALVYFFSQSCSACRTITPKVRALKAAGVFLVDVGQDLELARALNVMATPSTVELSDGRVAGFHVGPIPEAVLERFA